MRRQPIQPQEPSRMDTAVMPDPALVGTWGEVGTRTTLRRHGSLSSAVSGSPTGASATRSSRL
jgi:hypothetical protein